jgi:putative aminopeptidase FrvX
LKAALCGSKFMDNLLVNLINSYGISGNEDKIRDLIRKHLNENGHEPYIDSFGNIVVKKGSGKDKLMLCAHMDSTGFIVNDICEDGLISMESIGLFRKEDVSHSFIRFENGTLGKIYCCESGIFVDIGMSKKEDVLEDIKEGDTASLIGPYLVVGNNNIVSPLLHNKIGCYILLKLIENFKREDIEVYFVFSTQGEIGGIGARAAANIIDPDYAVVIGTKQSSSIDKKKKIIDIGKGPVLRIMDKALIIHQDIKAMLEDASKKSDVKLQYSIDKDESEGGLLHKELSGIRTGEIDVPCRYKYSISEMVSIDDIDETIKLLQELI